MVPLNIVTTKYLQQLKDELADTNGLSRYSATQFELSDQGLAETRIEISNVAPILHTQPNEDATNAIKVYEYLVNLDASAACDERIWAYMTHSTFRDYMIGRWPLNASDKDLLDKSNRIKTFTSVNDHWFYGQRGVVRNGIARLWWGAHVSIAPWERDDADFFRDIDKSDRYRYTKLLFSKSVIYQQIMERETTRTPRIKTALFEYIYENPDISKHEIGMIAKKIDLAKSYRKLETMDYHELRDVINKFAGK